MTRSVLPGVRVYRDGVVFGSREDGVIDGVWIASEPVRRVP